MRRVHEGEHVPIVISTAKADDASTWTGWKAGCDYYLTKPFDPEKLITVLEGLIEISAPEKAR